MAQMTPSQALKAARELKSDFGGHANQRLRRDIRQRKLPVDWKALGIEERVKDIAPFQSDTPNQEAQRYANAIASAEPEVAVFVAESEKTTRQKIGERLEGFYDAAVTLLLGDDYQRCLWMAGEGVGAGRLDLKPEFWKGIPKRGGLDGEEFNQSVDAQRRAIGLPFEFVDVDPLTLYYEENKKREIVVATEWGRRKRSAIDAVYQKSKNGSSPETFLGPTVPEGSAQSSNMVEFVVIRTPDIIYHATIGASEREDKVLWEGENLFAPSTGYILWRGLPSGFSDLDERYLPFIMNTLNVAQHWNLFMSIQANMGIRSLREWTEEDVSKQATAQLRQVSAEAKGTGKTKKSVHGSVVADLEAGRTLRWREISGDLKEVLARLDLEEERYRFPEPLAPESSSGESGRDTIRRQEASSRLLRQGFEARKQAVEELVRVVRRTLFGHKDFLADGRMIYLPHLVEGLGPEGTLRKQDVLSISEEDNIPHQVQITVATMTQAAQLALNEEGIRMEGKLSRDTIDQDYYQVKNIPLENRRRQKDLIRAATYPETVKRAILAVNERLMGRQAPGPDLLVPAEEGLSAPVPGPAISAQPTPPQREDVGLQAGGEGGVTPLVGG
jgi:hypothetical protein